jgi:hypothetical protein
MTWLAWRLQQTEVLIAAGILALIALLLVPTGIDMANVYHHDGIATCLGPKIGDSCSGRISDFQSRFQSLNIIANWFTLIPGLIGVLLAAPFILDLEHGTYRLAWTQSITRRRWLAVKLALPIATGVLASCALILLFTWWRAPLTQLNGRLDTGTYDTEGTVVIGYTLFALGLAVGLGAVWRRSAAALTVAFVGYFAMRVAVDYWLRDKLVSPLTATGRTTETPLVLGHANILSQSVTVNGHVVSSSSSTGGVVGGHSQIAAAGQGVNAVFHAVYQPASDFWALQIRETALFTAVGVVCILFAAWWTHERAA